MVSPVAALHSTRCEFPSKLPCPSAILTSCTPLALSCVPPFRDLIAANSFEQQDKKRTKGRNPVLQVVVSALDAQTFTSAEESSDNFELQMLKPSSNLKNTNGRVCEHYKLQNLKILEVSCLNRLHVWRPTHMTVRHRISPRLY